MLKYQDIVYISDLINLPKSILQDIGNKLNLSNINLNVMDIALEIYNKCNNNDEIWDKVISLARSYIFAGRTSVCWYRINKTDAEKTILQTIIDRIGFNPLHQKNPQINYENLPTTPQIIGGIQLDERKYLLRLIFSSGTRTVFNGLSPETQKITSFMNAIIDEDKNYIEIRGSDRLARKIADYFENVLSSVIEPLERKNIIAPFGNNIEQLADLLNGKLVEIISIPEEILSELTAEEADAIGNILIAIDEYFTSGDLGNLEKTLQASRAYFSEKAVPFTAIVLAGMSRLGMAADNELRSQPLFSMLQPYLQYQGGFLKFPLEEDGIRKYYTIKVGVRTNTIYFVTPSTEECIKYVRDKILSLT